MASTSQHPATDAPSGEAAPVSSARAAPSDTSENDNAPVPAVVNPSNDTGSDPAVNPSNDTGSDPVVNPSHDTGSDPGSEDLRLLPPDSRRLMDRLHTAGRLLRSCRVPFTHLLTFGLTALVVIQVVILLLRAQEPVPTERVEVAAATKNHTKPLICQRPGCILQAAETASFINHSVDPCKDFFQYACGRFREVYPSPLGETLGVDTVLRQRTNNRLMQLLQEDQYYNGSSAISKARLFFSTCMRVYQFSLNNVPDLVELLRQYGGLDLFGTWRPDTWNFNDLLINASALHLLDAFFETATLHRDLGVVDLHMPPTLDFSRSSSTSLFGLPSQKVTRRTRHLIREVLRQLEQDILNWMPHPARDCNATCVDEMAEDIVAVQEALLAITPRRKFFSRTEGVDSEMVTMSAMRLLVPQVDWPRLVDAMFGIDDLPDPLMFFIPSRSYMAGVGRIIDDTRTKRLHHFLVWPVIRRYLMALGPVYSTLGEELDLNIPNRKLLQTREQQCTMLLSRFMEPALHGLLLASHIGEESVPQARDHFMKQVFSVLRDSFGWMTEKSQNRSQNILDNIHVDFALGNLKQTLHGLDEYYAPLQFHKLKFFDNLRNLYGFTKPGKIGDGFRFTRRPADIGVRYDLKSGELTVPFSALQVPWYHKDVPDHLNAPSLGSLVYENLADSFFLSPLSPNMTYYWDDETQRRFRKFTHCLESSSKKSSVPPLKSILALFMPPRNTSSYLSPDTLIAINYYFAYHISYRLFERLREQGSNAVLPGMQHARSEQAFYLAFTHTRCSNDLPLFYVPADSVPGSAMIPVMSREPEVINHLILSDPGFREAYQCKGPVAAEHAMGLCSLF